MSQKKLKVKMVQSLNSIMLISHCKQNQNMLHSTNMENSIDLQSFSKILEEANYRRELITHVQLFWVVQQFNFYSLFTFADESPTYTQASFGETLTQKTKKNGTNYLSNSEGIEIIPIDTDNEKGIEIKLNMLGYEDRIKFVSLQELRTKVQSCLTN